MPFSAILDACSLYPQSLRDTLLRFAEMDIYRVLWSAEILDEMEQNLVERAHLDSDRTARLRARMEEAFPEAMVEGYHSLIASMTNDPKDRHVLAAAVTGRADVIVTHNVKHFPATACSPFGIDVQTPDEFLLHMAHLVPDITRNVLHTQAADTTNPPMSVDDVLQWLAQHAPDFVQLIRPHLSDTFGG